MATMQEPRTKAEVKNQEWAGEVRHERWAHWPVHWSSIWVGALTAFGVVVIFGLFGVAVGAHVLGPEHRVVDFTKTSVLAMVLSICGAFFAFVAGGWVAGKIAGILHSEPAMLNGAIVWLVTVPVLVAAIGLGAGSLMGGWFAGLGTGPGGAAGSPYVRPLPPPVGATSDDVEAYRADRIAYEKNIRQWNEDTPKVTRNVALGAATALLLGLIGSVIGGWLASGEPMNFSHYKTRKPLMYHSS